MIHKLRLCLPLFFIFTGIGFAQTPKKTLHTVFSKNKIVLDGKLNDESWKNAEIATDFVMLNPDNGKPIPKEKRTEVKVVYDNEAIYIGAMLYDNESSKIQKELTSRDDFATADHFGVFLNGYNDGQQEFRFFVSAAGVQQDVLYTETNGEDTSWNAIWDSKTQITPTGWVVEMKIPYAALRFSGEKKQTWGLNFYREIRRDRFQYTWNLMDNKISSESNQAGILEGIENITTPTRLFLIPYTSFYLENNKDLTKGELKGGMDVKYGINDAFTLDAILIPDFGQTAFDKVELNLGPFEQQFSENRPFFTEGTELFSKGDLFYSRRIGRPFLDKYEYSETLNSDEELTQYSSTINLLNALKISGRSKNGLGVGVLNAVTEKTYAEITKNTGEQRREVVEPLSNYNIFVLDQRFQKNSSISLINTNVMRNGDFRDANVTGLIFDLNTKENTFNMSGDFKYSYVNQYQDNNKSGYNTSLNFAETSGKYRYGIGGQLVSKDFDSNDLGINFLTDYAAVYGNASYRILKPNKVFNNFSIFLNYYTEFDNSTGKKQENSFNFNLNSTSKKNDYYGMGINARPSIIYDFYEPREENKSRYAIYPKYISGYVYFSSNYNRKFAIDVNPFGTLVDDKNRYTYGFSLSPRYRFNDKISLSYNIEVVKQVNNVGWVDTTALEDIIFAKRDRITYTNSIQGKYSVNNVMSFNLSIRHYWSFAENNEFLSLQENGELLSNPNYLENKNTSFDSWNLDLAYSWWFAPGSQVSILYRNNASIYENEFSKNFSTNVKSLLNQDKLNHIFSISVRYFIDYNNVKHLL